MKFSFIGIDFRTAPVELRERVSLSPEQVLELLRTIRAEGIFAESAIISTCNRTEFYFVPTETPETPNNAKLEPVPLPHLLGHIAAIKHDQPIADLSAFHRADDLAAAEHLFRVAASLDSQIVGEHEIMGQAKAAYRLACEARTAGFLIHKLFHRAFAAGKRVMAETRLGQGTASVSQAAVDLARQIFAHLDDKTVLLVGAGQTAELAVRALVRAGVKKLIIANRTLSHAQQLADQFVTWWREEGAHPTSPEDEAGLGATPKRSLLGGVRPRGQQSTCPALERYLLDIASSQSPVPASARQPELSAHAVSLWDIHAAIEQADLLISFTGATEPLLTMENVGPALRKLRRPLLMIDIAVPRDIDPALARLDNVFLYNIDSLNQLIEANIAQRRLEIPLAQAIVADELAQFAQWLSGLEVVPTIKLLQQHVSALVAAEVYRYRNKFPSGDREQLEEFARSLCAKIMHDPMSFLRQINADAGEGPAAVDLLRRIFNLDSHEKPRR